jgi:hypothetical protein
MLRRVEPGRLALDRGMYLDIGSSVLTMGAGYEVPADRVLHERIDDDVVIIHIASGNYYALGGSAVDVWANLLAGHSPQSIVAGLRSTYEGPTRREFERDVRRTVRFLSDEDLIITSGRGDSPSEAPVFTLAAYSGPQVERHTDMQRFLLLYTPPEEASAEPTGSEINDSPIPLPV